MNIFCIRGINKFISIPLHTANIRVPSRTMPKSRLKTKQSNSDTATYAKSRNILQVPNLMPVRSDTKEQKASGG